MAMIMIMIVDPPLRFKCPLTKQIMQDPVMSQTGPNFDRRAILQWLDDQDGAGTCPITGKALSRRALVGHAKLRMEIEKWKLTEGFASGHASSLASSESRSNKELKLEHSAHSRHCTQIQTQMQKQHVSSIAHASTTANMSSGLVLQDIPVNSYPIAFENAGRSRHKADSNAINKSVMEVLDEVINALGTLS